MNAEVGFSQEPVGSDRMPKNPFWTSTGCLGLVSPSGEFKDDGVVWKGAVGMHACRRLAEAG